MNLEEMETDADGALWGTPEMDERAELYASTPAVDTWNVQPPTHAAAREDIAAPTATQLCAVLLV